MPYTIGLDFGTLSARASILSTADGCALATAQAEYNVWETLLPDGTPVKPLSARSDADEMFRAMVSAIREAMRIAGTPSDEIIGIAVDATSMTVLPTDAQGAPLGLVKVWKSHSAQAEAEQIEAAARKEGHPLLDICGNKVSSEWFYPKALETLHDEPALFRQAAYFVDLCDWITWRLTGRLTRSFGGLGFKSFYGEDGLPSGEFWARVDPDFADINAKLAGDPIRWGERAGALTEEMAGLLGLRPGCAVAGGSLDGHVPLAALGLRRDGDMLLSIGTSNVFAFLSEEGKPIKGVCGLARDGMMPGFVAYDAGQAAVGDLFAWYVENCLPEQYAQAAQTEGLSVHTYLSRLAFAQPPQPENPIALDWWNGNRAPLGKLDLTGAFLGLSLRTRPEDLYRALVEATAFGARRIMDNFTAHGMPVRRIFVCGGIAAKNAYLVQCYADILGHRLYVSQAPNAASSGAAILAATAAGQAAGGYDRLCDAIDAMSSRSFVEYTPDKTVAACYTARYERYLQFSDALQDML